MDVDIIVEGVYAQRIVERFLSVLSERIGRGYLPMKPLDTKSIDIVSTVYSRKVKPVKIVANGFYVYVEPPEELIVTYLSGWKFKGSAEDRDKALWLYTVWRDRIDEEYLCKRALEENVYDKYEELKKLYEEVRKRLGMI